MDDIARVGRRSLRVVAKDRRGLHTATYQLINQQSCYTHHCSPSNFDCRLVDWILLLWRVGGVEIRVSMEPSS